MEGSGNIHDIACYLVYRGQIEKDPEKEEKYYLEAEKYFKESHNTKKHLYRGLCLIKLANFYILKEQLKFVESIFSDAHIILEKLKHPFLGLLYFTMAIYFIKIGNVYEAEKYSKESLKLFKDIYFKFNNHPNLINATSLHDNIINLKKEHDQEFLFDQKIGSPADVEKNKPS